MIIDLPLFFEVGLVGALLLWQWFQ